MTVNLQQPQPQMPPPTPCTASKRWPASQIGASSAVGFWGPPAPSPTESSAWLHLCMRPKRIVQGPRDLEACIVWYKHAPGYILEAGLGAGP